MTRTEYALSLLLYTLVACVWYRRVPYIPIQLSKIFNYTPARELFICNSVVVVSWLIPAFVGRSAFAAIVGCVLTPFIAIASDAEHKVLHTLIATATFFCFGLQLWLWDALGWATPILQVLNLFTFLPVAWTHRSLLQQCCPPVLWPIALRVIEFFKAADVEFAERVRGTLQWTTVFMLIAMYMKHM